MKNFQLGKVKVNNDGVEVSFQDDFAEWNLVPKKNQPAHPDLVEAIKKLNPFLAQSNGLFYHRMVEVPPKKKEIWDGKEIQHVLNKIDEHILASVIPSGISLSGSGEGYSVVITGKREVHGTAVAMNSPKISCHNDSFGFNVDDLFAVVDEIIEETKKYIIEGKSSQASLEFENEAEEKEEVAA